jgi:DNA polymerase
MASPGHELISSDYSAIEAVVLAVLAKEQWRIEVFQTHGKIYEASAAAVSGVSLQEILNHKSRTGEQHPLRALGKVAELASGYQGSEGAWKKFGADKFMTDVEINAGVKKWRKESPNIVNFWYGLERIAIAAVQNPGSYHSYNEITYGCNGNTLYCRLPSGRLLCYQQPSIVVEKMPWGSQKPVLYYWGWNSDATKGPIGWIRISTYGGKLCENVVQATARDILTYAMLNLDRAGWSIVLHVHDEIVCEDATGRNVEELEDIMNIMPPWAKGWPIKASGGWKGRRYRKG